MVLSGNTLYGTAAGYPVLTVFAVNTDGTGFTNLYSSTNGSFNATGVTLQVSGLILSSNTLYGIEMGCASELDGGCSSELFALNTDGTGFTNLYSFGGGDGPWRRSFYFAGLILSDNTLYGTTSAGGGYDIGTVFALNTDGTGFTNLYSFPCW